MATIRQFEDLEIWQLAREICKRVNSLTSDDKFNKNFTLRNQMNSSSGSAMDCIAEGFERDGNKEFIHFLTVSKASIGETRSQAYRALDFRFITESEFEDLKQECLKLSRKTSSFINYLKNSELKGLKFKRGTDDDSSQPKT